MSVTRRSLLKAGALSVTGPWPLACGDHESDAQPDPFLHGVASGDPWPESVILWTRLSVPDADAALSGEWQVFDTASLDQVVAEGRYETDAARDFTVKVEAKGLEPGTTYYFRFRHAGVTSVIGRTRTAPAGDTERLRVAVFSCAAYAAGHFHAYRAVSVRPDIDLVVHLGDYIYEYGDGGFGSVRSLDPPHEALSLSDYRLRYAHYRTDPDLVELHRQFPMIAVWDDHEVANNAWKSGAENHQDDEGSYAERKRAAQQAYFEWLPIRELEPGRVHRSFGFGNLVELVCADTRHWGRTRQLAEDDPDFQDEARSLLGADQERWLEEQLLASEARWHLLAQQVMLSRFPLGVLNTDAWEGYPAARKRFLEMLRQHSIANLVVLTGDIHMSWAFDLVEPEEEYDPTTGLGSLGVELVTPSVTSSSLERDAAEKLASLALEEPRVRLAQLWRRGYLLLDIDHERCQAEWYLFDRVDGPADEVFYEALLVRDGEGFLRNAPGPAEAPSDAPALAPGEIPLDG